MSRGVISDEDLSEMWRILGTDSDETKDVRITRRTCETCRCLGNFYMGKDIPGVQKFYCVKQCIPRPMHNDFCSRWESKL